MFVSNVHRIQTDKILFTLFYIFGMWQPRAWNSAWKIWLYHFYAAFMITIYFTFSITLFIYLFRMPKDINIFIEYLYYYIYSVVIFMKHINIVIKRKSLIESKYKLLNKLCQPRDLYELEILKKCSQDCRWKIITILVVFSIFAATTFMSPLAKRSNLELPLQGWYPYNLNNNPFFCITYFYQIIVIVMSAYIIASVDGLAFTQMLQICAQLEICTYRLQILPKLRKNVDSKVLLCHQESRLLKDCTRHHKYLYSLGKKLNDLFSWVIFIQFFASILSLCVIIYQLSKLNSHNPSYWVMVSCLGSTLIQTFLYCYYGEKIIEKSIAVTDAVYEISWFDLSNGAKKHLMVMMLRATKPIQLTGGSLIVMSIKTFVKIMKSAYSAYNLLGNI